jgi:hypothetical protein
MMASMDHKEVVMRYLKALVVAGALALLGGCVADPYYPDGYGGGYYPAGVAVGVYPGYYGGGYYHGYYGPRYGYHHGYYGHGW